MDIDVQLDRGRSSPLTSGTADQLQVIVDAALTTATETSLRVLRDALAAAAPSDTGGFGASLMSDPATSLGGIELLGHGDAGGDVTGRVFSSLPYAGVLEDGRLPGTHVNAAGLQALTSWAERKLGASGQDAVRAAFAIATLIERRGLPAHHIVEQATAAAAATLETMLGEAGAALASQLAGS